MIRIITFSNLFPNQVQSRHGIFVEQRLLNLVKLGGVQAKVVAPVPWVPIGFRGLKKYQSFSKVLNFERRKELDVYHPRYLTVPKIGKYFSPFFMAISMLGILKSILKSGFEFDVIDAHYFYPDGVAACLVGKWLNKPVVITARGTDINVLPEYFIPKLWILWAARQAVAINTVSHALKEKLTELGIDAGKITVLRNGVDLDLFKPGHRQLLREKYGLEKFTLLSVGNLVAEKGHELAIEAAKELEQCELIVIGDGPKLQELKQLTKNYGIESKVRFVGVVPQELLKEYYSSADALLLLSLREGMPNVVLESFACGLPVIANRVGGVPEILQTGDMGVLLVNRDCQSVVEAVNRLQASSLDRTKIRSNAEQFSWETTSAGQKEIFQKIMSQ